jgi:hypothetical protein
VQRCLHSPIRHAEFWCVKAGGIHSDHWKIGNHSTAFFGVDISSGPSRNLPMETEPVPDKLRVTRKLRTTENIPTNSHVHLLISNFFLLASRSISKRNKTLQVAVGLSFFAVSPFAAATKTLAGTGRK